MHVRNYYYEVELHIYIATTKVIVCKSYCELSLYSGSPNYAKISNAVPYFRGYGLCMSKWGIFALVGDLLQSH